jgi:hypothetical protein
MTKVCEKIRFAVITRCEARWNDVVFDEKGFPVQKKTDIPLFAVPSIQIITKEYERTLDGNEFKLYRHDIEYEVFDTLEGALNRYLELKGSLPNGDVVGKFE